MWLCLAAMCLMVFGNVVLRHFFNSGVNIAEELSRFMFIWLTFLGAIVAMRDVEHLGVDVLVARLTGRRRFAAVLLGKVLVLMCCGVLLWGLLLPHVPKLAPAGLQHGLSMSNVSSTATLFLASIVVLSF